MPTFDTLWIVIAISALGVLVYFGSPHRIAADVRLASSTLASIVDRLAEMDRQDRVRDEKINSLNGKYEAILEQIVRQADACVQLAESCKESAAASQAMQRNAEKMCGIIERLAREVAAK